MDKGVGGREQKKHRNGKWRGREGGRAQALSIHLQAPTSLGNQGGALSHGSRGSWDLADCLNMQS